MDYNQYCEEINKLRKAELTAYEQRKSLEEAWDQQQREPETRKLMAKGPRIIEGVLQDNNSDYDPRVNYVSELDDYLDDIPSGVTLKITVEITKP